MRLKKAHGAVIGALLGAAFFLWLYPASILDPTNTLWLMQGDGAQHFLGWHFYRGDAWQFPIGINRQYGQAMGSAIVFSDSIPVLALLFKLFDAWLPKYFQYTGFWMLLCYVLQGAFAWKIGEALRLTVALKIALTFMLVTATVMVERAWGHFALMGHWLLLAAIYAYLTRQSAARWMVLIAITALVHAYLLYMVLAVWAADWVRKTAVEKCMPWPRARLEFLLTLCVLGMVMWQIGYFTVGLAESTAGTHYGNYAAGLHSLWNPGWGSRLLPPIAVRAGTEMEGGAYLGAGGLLLLVLAILAALRAAAALPVALRPVALLPVALRSVALRLAKGALKSRTDKAGMPPYWPLVLVAVICAALALSNRVYYGTFEVFSFALPAILQGKLDLIRGSGRLLWLLFYSLLIGGFGIIAHHLSAFKASLIAVVVCGLQIIDLSPRATIFRGLYARHLANNARDADTLKSVFWHDPKLQKYQHIVVQPMLHMAPRFAALGLFAADHKMSINVGYFARVPMACFAEGRLQEAEFREGNFRANTLYVVQTANISVVKSAWRAQDGIGEIDGMTVVAPGWFADGATKSTWLRPMAAP